MIRKAAQFVICVAFLLSIPACTPIEKQRFQPTEVQSRDQAGAILLSVNSVAPWSRVAGALQPSFTLTDGDAALAKVVPRTARVQQQVLDALGLSLAVGIPKSFKDAVKKEETTTTQPETGSATTTKTTTETKTSTKQPGVAPTPPTGTPAGGQLPSDKAPTLDPSLDPFLQYKAAASLYQSVQMLNREIHNLALRADYVPYMVRLQLAVMPYRKHLPYDLHAQIAFFCQRAKGDKGKKVPIVVPILATDNLERSIRSRAFEMARQIGLALSVMIQGVGGEFGFNSQKRDQFSILADDVNSLLTVSRLTANTLYARIGAANEATAGNALVGRTYDIAVVLLVPDGYYEHDGCQVMAGATRPRISINAYTELRHANDGTILPTRSIAAYVSQLDAAFNDVMPFGGQFVDAWNALDTSGKLKKASPFISAVIQSNQQSFENKACAFLLTDKGKCNYGYVRSLWIRLANVIAESAFKTTSFDLPDHPKVSIISQTVLLKDDAKTSTSAVVRNAYRLTSEIVSAHLWLKKGQDTYEIPHENLSVSTTDGTIRITFPSLKKWGLSGFDPKASRLVIEIHCPYASQVCPQGATNFGFSILYAEAAAQE